MNTAYPVTPDGRYFVVRNRLWRCTNPSLEQAEKMRWVSALMSARRAKGVAMRAGDQDGRERAKRDVEAAKIALGERGPVWWTDAAPDLNRCMVEQTPYAAWFASIELPGS